MSLFLTSCSKDNYKGAETSETKSTSATQSNDPIALGETIVLGAQLENPYSVENMQLAYNSLVKEGKQIPQSLSVYTSHYYVRFLPEDENELDFLLQDSTIELFDYPLDYEIVTPGILV
ncbi:hypothetical protein HNS38_18700 [Lentimicrobium sp. L6]|uniref:hypothetical protein n=1 Tax=Lentimicrobium sp. L6 TaxID=2735916 RepID=UPI001557652E|nr:hypothetical protein [Lentimicrobium sp. L6]NPD86799.1 hypothetical protein [Lentimicrobium sp. L6]